jgi:glycine betaine/choline ABC-type transport system substrate-binding protein
MGGIRISLVSVIAAATIAPLANVDTLGRPIISPNVYGTAGQLTSCIVLALVTFGADAAFAAVQRAVTPEASSLPNGAGRPTPRLPVIEEEHADIVRRTHPLLALLTALCLGSVVTACGGDDEKSSSSSSSSSSSDAPGNEIQKVSGAESKPTITVGSKNLPEQFVLGEIYSQALEAAGFKVKKSLDIGSEQIAHKALQGGKIDAYPEYTATALINFFKVKPADIERDANKAYEDTKAFFAKEDITALAPTPFENSYRLGMTKEGAAKIGNPKVMSDLKGKVKDLTITGYPECNQRQDCLFGLQDTYGLKFGKFITSQQPYQVLDSGDADVAIISTTDGDLAGGKYEILGDDKKFFPPYNITFSIRDEALKSIGSEGQKVIEDVQKPLTAKVMQELNARAVIDKQKPAVVAKSYLQQAGFIK